MYQAIYLEVYEHMLLHPGLLQNEFPRDKRIAREAQDKRIAEIVAWMQSSTGSPVPPGLMGPPTHPNQSPLMQTPLPSAGSNNPLSGAHGDQVFPSPPSQGCQGRPAQ